MRRVVFSLLAATALLLGSLGAVAAAPSGNASCAATIFMLVAPGGEVGAIAQEEGGLGSAVGNRDEGFAHTRPCT